MAAKAGGGAVVVAQRGVRMLRRAAPRAAAGGGEAEAKAEQRTGKAADRPLEAVQRTPREADRPAGVEAAQRPSKAHYQPARTDALAKTAFGSAGSDATAKTAQRTGKAVERAKMEPPRSHPADLRRAAAKVASPGPAPTTVSRGPTKTPSSPASESARAPPPRTKIGGTGNVGAKRSKDGVTHGMDAPFSAAVRLSVVTRRVQEEEEEEEDDDDAGDPKRSDLAEFGNFKVPTLELPQALQDACARVLAEAAVPTSTLRRDAEQLAQSLVSLTTLPPHRDVVHGHVPTTFSDLLAAGQLRGHDEGAIAAGLPPLGGARPDATSARLAALFPEHELAKLADAQAEESLQATRPVEDAARPARTYEQRDALAYIAYRMAPIYGSVTRVLQELYYRLPRFNPASMLDFGTGPGTAIWAAHATFEGSIKDYLAVDISENMLNIADALLAAPASHGGARAPPAIPGVRTQRFLGQAKDGPGHDLVLASYVLNEIPSRSLREATLASLWGHTRDILVLIEPGTPQGFANILQARELFLGSRPAVHPSAVALRDSPLHLIAPCPHEAACPMKAHTWCHFVQRVARTDESRLARGNVHLSYDDEKFSYLVLRRGPRPLDALLASTPPRPATTKDELSVSSLTWPRLVRQPMRRTGHVILDLCSPPADGRRRLGVLERRVIPKSQGKRMYKDARNNFWGNLWPYPLPIGKRRVSRP